MEKRRSGRAITTLDNPVSITELKLLAQEYFKQPSEKKRLLIEEHMHQYAKTSTASGMKELLHLRLYLYQKSQNLEERLRF